ncbi:MAG: acetate/propionate family kinase [Burkholderiaceae bacterium]
MPAGGAHILTLNAGSSSLKYALFAHANGSRLMDGQVEGLGVGGLSHEQALQQILTRIDPSRVVAVGHRIVHGGVRFAAPVRIDDEVLAAMAALEPLAPLHQPHNLTGVRAAMRVFPHAPQVACFDTAFHRTMPDVHQRFALPRALHDAGVRRYGFHGLSYESIQRQLAERDGALAAARVVVAHLGNGASMCAMRAGRSVATTMSFSPLDGLPMGTRCGRIDGAAVLYLAQRHDRDLDRVAELLYRESGLLGLSGLSSDLRTLLKSSSAGALEAIEYFVEHIQAEIAGMAAALRGIDALVFTGGIGENAHAIREHVVRGLEWMGLKLDAQAHAAKAERISAADSAAAVWVLHTDEEAVIARHTARAIAGKSAR